MDSCIPVRWTKSVLLLALSALTFVISHINGFCTPAVNIPRNTQYNAAADQPFILRCPVQSCSKELPKVTWCKVTGRDVCDPVSPGEGISFKWQEQTENYAVHVLEFVSVQVNDTGLYKCSADYHEQRAVGSVIKLEIFHVPDPFIPDTSKTWTTYFFISVRLIIVIVVYTLLYYYLRKIKESNKVSNSTLMSSTVKFKASSKNVGIIYAKRHIESSYHQHPDRDPPTESFGMICDDLDTCDEELTVVLPQRSPNAEELKNNE